MYPGYWNPAISISCHFNNTLCIYTLYLIKTYSTDNSCMEWIPIEMTGFRQTMVNATRSLVWGFYISIDILCCVWLLFLLIDSVSRRLMEQHVSAVNGRSSGSVLNRGWRGSVCTVLLCVLLREKCQRWAVWMGVSLPPSSLLERQWGRTFPGLKLCLGVMGYEEERDSYALKSYWEPDRHTERDDCVIDLADRKEIKIYTELNTRK